MGLQWRNVKLLNTGKSFCTVHVLVVHILTFVVLEFPVIFSSYLLFYFMIFR